MTEMEKAIVKEMAHEFFDKDLPMIIEAEEARVPMAYQGLVKMVMAVILPQVIAAMDAKIDAFTAPAVV